MKAKPRLKFVGPLRMWVCQTPGGERNRGGFAYSPRAAYMAWWWRNSLPRWLALRIDRWVTS